uniref:Putative secreted protein n=1 Tax=Anopheles darlingi TaxID=43151 RepID=A0A2M4DPK3_ANODA
MVIALVAIISIIGFALRSQLVCTLDRVLHSIRSRAHPPKPYHHHHHGMGAGEEEIIIFAKMNRAKMHNATR